MSVLSFFARGTLFSCFSLFYLIDCSVLIVTVDASDWLERLVSKMTFSVLMGALNLTHSVDTHSPTARSSTYIWCQKVLWRKTVNFLETCGKNKFTYSDNEIYVVWRRKNIENIAVDVRCVSTIKFSTTWCNMCCIYSVDKLKDNQALFCIWKDTVETYSVGCVSPRSGSGA